jgi:hypothetical protein
MHENLVRDAAPETILERSVDDAEFTASSTQMPFVRHSRAAVFVRPITATLPHSYQQVLFSPVLKEPQDASREVDGTWRGV